MYKYFFLIIYNSGANPKEILGLYIKIKYKYSNEKWGLKEHIESCLRWCDIKIKSTEKNKSINIKNY
tara:strand:+ start:306 stop:506 length:201 start_codon:yes stop_codon:yes gene_type:complete